MNIHKMGWVFCLLIVISVSLRLSIAFSSFFTPLHPFLSSQAVIFFALLFMTISPTQISLIVFIYHHIGELASIRSTTKNNMLFDTVNIYFIRNSYFFLFISWLLRSTIKSVLVPVCLLTVKNYVHSKTLFPLHRLFDSRATLTLFTNSVWAIALFRFRFIREWQKNWKNEMRIE